MFTLNGILIGFLFDFFRILRKTFKTTNIVTYIEDIIFWILTGISVIFFMYKFSDGALRLFMFLGLCCGIVLYMLAFSKIVVKLFISIIEAIVKIVFKIIKLLKIPLNCINKIFKPIYMFYIKIKDILTKKLKKLYYNLKNKIKIQKN